MLALKQKTVLITGASSGIGKASAKQFAAHGANVILTARRLDRITALAESLQEEYKIEALPIKLDVQDQEAVAAAIEKLPKKWQVIDVLVNNAGLGITSDPIQNGLPKNWDVMIDTNVKGLLYVTHAILPGMLDRNSGHIINIGSTAAHDYYPGGNVYCATKHAVKALTKSLRIDLLGRGIRVSEIDPGMVHTEFSEVRWKDKEKADNFYRGLTPLVSSDIADAVIYCATRPLHVNVSELVVFPTEQASANHLHRNGQEKSKGILE